jgi:ribonuclease P protein component
VLAAGLLQFCDQNMKTFKKEERLCSRKSLDLLFKNGSSFLLYPYRISHLFIVEQTDVPVQVVINVSKKRFKKAVDRNLIKRRTREAYRMLKTPELYTLLPLTDKLLLLSIQFIGKKHYPYDFLEKKLGGALKKLTAKLAIDEIH